MKIKEISVTYGGKLNLGDYNSAHIEATATAEIEEGEDYQACLKALFSGVRFEARLQAAELIEKRKSLVNSVFASLPADVQQAIKE